jgi:glucose 1-dehydrogenase
LTATAAADVAGRLAIVTGAARGIGHGVASRLAAAGARVIATDRDSARLAHAFSDGEVALLELDVAASESEALCDAVISRFGVPELIVNNVGITTEHGFLDLPPGDFDHVFRTNLRGPWFLTRGLVQALVESGARGNVVFVSSLHDRRIGGHPHYSASKAAISMLVRELAYELAGRGIRVNAVSPGYVPNAGARTGRRTRRLIPLGRAGHPDDVASIVTVLLSDDLSGYVTGVNVPVDGGLGLYTWADS